MALREEFARILFKRSTVTGVVPTIPASEPVEPADFNSLLSTDILIGEGFINVEDDKFWFRTNNGITSLALSGVTDLFTTGATLSGNTLIFDRNDEAAAYSVDLSSLSVTGSTDYVSNVSLSGSNLIFSSVGDAFDGSVDLSSIGGTFTGGTVAGDVTFEGDVVMDEISATTLSILNSGATIRDYVDYSGNKIETGVTNSAIAAGSGNTINADLRNVFISGVDLTGTTNDTSYFSNVNIAGDAIGMPYDLLAAISDETTAITTGTSKIAFYAPRNFEVTKVKVSLSTSGSTTTTVDVNVNGTTMLTAPISLSSGVFVNSTTSLATSTIDEDDRITVDIDAAGTDAAGAKIVLIGKSL